jgi:hypothetical protein
LSFTLVSVQVVPQYLLPWFLFQRFLLAHESGTENTLSGPKSTTSKENIFNSGYSYAFFETFYPIIHKAAWAVILHQVVFLEDLLLHLNMFVFPIEMLENF